MLCTIGMTRRQARRMIRHESVITALIGATLEVGLGAFTIVAVLAGIGAAILPGRRASRLNVRDAVQYE
jgi:putative ABC transport system permease protein